MKKYLVAIVMTIVFVLGIINGITQKQSIAVVADNSFDKNRNIGYGVKKDGFVNNKKKPIISKNHIIYLAKKELPKEMLKNYDLIIVEYVENYGYYSVFFTSKALQEYCDNLDPMSCLINDAALFVYIDKNGVTQHISGMLRGEV